MHGYYGHEFIKIRGSIPSKFTIKAIVWGESTYATLNYSWGKFAIFTGVFGGDLLKGDLWDGGDGVMSYYDDSILKRLQKIFYCSICQPANIKHLTSIANSNQLGGITAIAWNVSGTVLSRSSINSPGNSDWLRADIETYYRENPHAKILLTGFSAGGGDIQNLLWKLKELDIPVTLSGHIDSVDLGGDAKISDNTVRAMGFHQKDGIFLTQGEDNIYAEDSEKTIVTNERIDKPQGPKDPLNDENAYHRNMDNDVRVWKPILDYIKTIR